MFTIVYYVPQSDLVDIAWEVYETHPLKDSIELVVLTGPQTPLGELAPRCDAIVARGLDAGWLAERYPHIPVITIKISPYDILDVLTRCMRDHGAKTIALVGAWNMYEGAERFADAFSLDLRRYMIHDYETIEYAIRQALADGCEAIVGGSSICRVADAMGVRRGHLRTGPESIRAGILEAVEMTRMMQLEHQRTESLRQIAESAKNAILVVNEAREFVTVNSIARRIADSAIAAGAGRNIQEVFAFLADQVDEVFATGKEILTVLHEIDGRIFDTGCVPVMVKNSVASVVVTLVDVALLQQAESKIRNKLHAKGLEATHHFEEYIHNSPDIAAMIGRAKKMAVVDSTIFIVGASGTGKELLAQSIHNYSPRRNQPFVAVNCAALPENLLESELFGYSPGAFTGSSKEGKMGLFELAHGGTLFLDEITEMPMNSQSKVLRAIQESKIRRIGGDSVTTIDVRIIAATNVNPMAMVEKGLFRRDLLFRLNVLQLSVPPLSARREDIIPLFLHFVAGFNAKFNKNITAVSPEARELLIRYPWPGNVRELRNIAEQLCVLSASYTIETDAVQSSLYPTLVDDSLPIQPQPPAPRPDTAPERDHIIRILTENQFNKNDTAAALGISRVTLWRKLKKYRITV